MPDRILREGIRTSERVQRLSIQHELLFLHLLTAADDYGRFEANPRVLRAVLMPLRLELYSEQDVGNALQAFQECGLTTQYIGAEKTYGVIFKVQLPRAKASKFPPPPDGVQCWREAAMGPVLGSHGSSACICAQTRAQESTPAHMSPVSYSESKSKSKTEDVNGRSPPREAFTPEPAEAAAVHTDLPGRETTFFRQKRPDYQRIGRLPPISSYEQLQEQRYDPVLLAMALTGGSEKEDWGFWVKKLNKGRKELGDDQAERMFRNCLDTVFGEMKQNELVKPPGARLNVLLKEAFD